MDLMKEIKETLTDYPTLIFSKKKWRIEGEFEIKNEETNVVLESYTIEILIPKQFLKVRLPMVTEVSHKIPRHPDRHVYKDGLFCLGTALSEYLICREGITFRKFLEEILKPFLATQLAISVGWLKSFPQGEYEHGAVGVFQAYCEFFKINNIDEIITAIKIGLKKNQRNTLCYCSSGKKIKSCHLDNYKIIRNFNKKQLQEDLKIIECLP